MQAIERRPGDVNGRLTLVEEVQRDPNDPVPSRARWRLFKFKCDCGNEVITHWKPQSCGCLQREAAVMAGKSRRKGLGEAAFHSLWLAYVNGSTRRELEFRLTKEEFRALTSAKCFYCGIPPISKKHGKIKTHGAYIYNGIDRVNNTAGYTADNCVTCCTDCNQSKHTRTQQEFYDWIKRLHANLSSKNLL